MKPTVPPEPAPPTHECHRCGTPISRFGLCVVCDALLEAECGQKPIAAAPPTVAPARPLDLRAEAAKLAHAILDAEPATMEPVDVAYANLVHLLERDRASRSPGAAVVAELIRALDGSSVLDLRDSDELEALLGWLADYDAAASALLGEGPSPAREGMELKSGPPPLSGLDAATVEACAREAEAYDAAPLSERHVTTAARIRALATPPGQTKP